MLILTCNIEVIKKNEIHEKFPNFACFLVIAYDYHKQINVFVYKDSYIKSTTTPSIGFLV